MSDEGRLGWLQLDRAVKRAHVARLLDARGKPYDRELLELVVDTWDLFCEKGPALIEAMLAEKAERKRKRQERKAKRAAAVTAGE